VTKEDQQRLLRKAFSDISRGYSVAFLDGKRLYVKHLSHHEQVDLDVLHQSFVEEALNAGVEPETTKLKYLEEQGIWTAEDDKLLDSMKDTIERLVVGKKVIYLKADLDNQNKLIEAEQRKYNQKRREREQVLGLTAQSYAERKINEYYIIESFFLDDNFSKRYLSEEIFQDLTDEDIQHIVKSYNNEMETVSDRSIKKLAIQDFFQMYWSLSSENLYNFFGRPICNLTYFQVKLGTYGRMFRDILLRAENLPPEIRDDPDKMLDYVRAGENAKEKMQGAASQGPSSDGAVASTLMGAKTEDYKAVGIKSDMGASVSLSEELKKKQSQGKKGLDMHDLMKLMGAS